MHISGGFYLRNHRQKAHIERLGHKFQSSDTLFTFDICGRKMGIADLHTHGIEIVAYSCNKMERPKCQ
jgi:hypothetical protein